MLINTDPKTKKSILAAMTLAEYESLTTAEKTVIELSQYAEAEAYSILETAKLDGHTAGMEKGRQEGMEKGLQKGLHQKAVETAKNLLQIGLEHEQIAQGLGLDTVRALQTHPNDDET